MSFRLANFNLTLAHSKGEDQGHAHFNCKDIWTLTDFANIAISDKVNVRSAYLDLTFVNIKGQSYGQPHLDGENL